jgi:hypothetical protein
MPPASIAGYSRDTLSERDGVLHLLGAKQNPKEACVPIEPKIYNNHPYE